MSIKKNVLMPEYAKDFQCTGSECPDTCCKEWTISIDKKTYKKYMSCPDPEILEKLKKCVLVGKNPQIFAEMSVSGPEHTCQFLTEDRMCELQRKFGADYLCATCKIYPRDYTCINNNYTLSLSPSCPEVARHFLKPEKMRFIYAESNPYNYSASKLLDEHYEDFCAVRDYIIDILQDRRYIFEMRLILLGLFIQKITKSDFKNIKETISNYKTMFRDTRIADQFFELPVMPDFQFDIITQIFSQNNFTTGQKQYEVLFNETLRGLQFDEEHDVRQRMQSYIDALVKYEENFLKWDNILENYFVNTVFAFPQNIFKAIAKDNTNQLWEFYLYLCVSYRMLKFHMIGINELRGLTEDEVVSIISHFHRGVFGHNQNAVEKLVTWLTEKKYDTLAYMALLVRT